MYDIYVNFDYLSGFMYDGGRTFKENLYDRWQYYVRGGAIQIMAFACFFAFGGLFVGLDYMESCRGLCHVFLVLFVFWMYSLFAFQPEVARKHPIYADVGAQVALLMFFLLYPLLKKDAQKQQLKKMIDVGQAAADRQSSPVRRASANTRGGKASRWPGLTILITIFATITAVEGRLPLAVIRLEDDYILAFVAVVVWPFVFEIILAPMRIAAVTYYENKENSRPCLRHLFTVLYLLRALCCRFFVYSIKSVPIMLLTCLAQGVVEYFVRITWSKRDAVCGQVLQYYFGLEAEGVTIPQPAAQPAVRIRVTRATVNSLVKVAPNESHNTMSHNTMRSGTPGSLEAAQNTLRSGSPGSREAGGHGVGVDSRLWGVSEPIPESPCASMTVAKKRFTTLEPIQNTNILESYRMDVVICETFSEFVAIVIAGLIKYFYKDLAVLFVFGYSPDETVTVELTILFIVFSTGAEMTSLIIYICIEGCDSLEKKLKQLYSQNIRSTIIGFVCDFGVSLMGLYMFKQAFYLKSKIVRECSDGEWEGSYTRVVKICNPKCQSIRAENIMIAAMCEHQPP